MTELPTFTREATFRDLLDPAMKIAQERDHEAAKAVQEVFGATHPVFGRAIPTYEEAFDAGFQIAAGIKPT